MKGIRKLLIITFCAINVQVIAQSTNIGRHLKVNFSIEPEITEAENIIIYTIDRPKYILIITYINMDNNPNYIINPGELEKMYSGVINGTLAAAKDSKLLNKKKFKVGKHKGCEINYTFDLNEFDDIPATKKILLIEKSIYIIEIINIFGKDQKELKSFYKSISLQ